MYKWLCSIVIMVFFSGFSAISLAENTVFTSNQTSASMIIKYAEKRIANAPEDKKDYEEKKFFLLYDVYIKARSYAILNKLFFWLSVFSALIVLLWPSLSVIFKSQLTKWEWLKSATVQTTVTAIAALMFSFYSQYKDKQSYAESLMRHLIFSEKSAHELSLIVAEELAKIDKGFSFNFIIKDDGAAGES